MHYLHALANVEGLSGKQVHELSSTHLRDAPGVGPGGHAGDPPAERAPGAARRYETFGGCLAPDARGGTAGRMVAAGKAGDFRDPDRVRA